MEKPADRKKTTIIVPVYYNEQSLAPLFERISGVEKKLNEMSIELELIFVDDGSGDNSIGELLKIKEARNSTKIIKFTRNFGCISAMKAAMKVATGDCIIIMPADLQTAPEVTLDLIDKWEKGAKYAVCLRKNRDDPFLSRIFSSIYYKLVRYMVMNDYPKEGYDTLLMDKEIKYHYNNSGKNIYTPIYLFWLGYKPEYIYYDREKREFGKSRWTIGKKATAFLDTILGFSIIPIRAMLVIGFIVSISSFFYGILVFLYRIFGHVEVKGFAALATLISFLLGLIISMLGLIGEYLWRVYDEVSKRPEYVIDEEY